MHSTVLVLFLACGEEEPPALPTAVETPTSSSPELEVVAPAINSDDPWMALAEVSDTDRSEAVQDALEMRALERAAESTRIDGAVVRLEAALARSCGGQAEFDALVAVERASLEKDRVLLETLLGEHGPDLRAELWEDRSGLAEALTGPYTTTNKRNHRPVPSFMGDDEDVEEKRLLLALSLSSEGAKLDGEAAIADAVVAIASSDPEDGASVTTTVAALEAVQEQLLAAQAVRFSGLQQSCSGLSDDRWLTLLGNEAVGKFLGVVGGESGFVIENTALAGKASKSGKAGPGGQGMGQGGQGMGPGGQGMGQGGQGMGQGGQGMGQGGQGMGQGGQGMGQGGQGMGQGGQGMGQGGQGMGQGGQGGQGGPSGKGQKAGGGMGGPGGASGQTPGGMGGPSAKGQKAGAPGGEQSGPPR